MEGYRGLVYLFCNQEVGQKEQEVVGATINKGKLDTVIGKESDQLLVEHVARLKLY